MAFVGLIEDNATDINEKECDRGYCIEKDNFVFYHASRVATFSSPMVFAGSENARKDILKNAADMETIVTKEVVCFASEVFLFKF